MSDFVCPRLDLSLGLQNPPAVPRPIIGGHFIERNLNIVVGQPGAYKTIFMLEVCSAIALGRPAFGLYPVEEGRVVFITGDDPPEIVIDRLLMLNATIVDGKRVIDTAVRKKLAANIDVRNIDQVVTLLNRDISRFIEKTLKGASFAVLDPLRHFIGQTDENKAHEIYEQLAPLRQLATSLPCAIAMIHHSKKDGGTAGKMNEYRGSGALRGLSRAQLNIERVNPGINPPRINVLGENRYGAEPLPLTLEIDHVDGVITFTQPGLIDSIYKTILESKTPLSTNDIIKAFNEPAATVRRALYRLRDKGLAAAHKDGKQNVWKRTTQVDTSIATRASNRPAEVTAGAVTEAQREHTAGLGNI